MRGLTWWSEGVSLKRGWGAEGVSENGNQENLFGWPIPSTTCHFERSAAKMFQVTRLIGAESRNPQGGRTTMLIQGVSTRDCPGNLTSRPQLSARSCQRGFNFSINQIFFSRRQRFICFSRLMATTASW